MRKKIMIAGAGLLVLLVACYFTFFRNDNPKYEFRFDRVSSGDISMVVTATGTVNPVTSVEVGTQVSGIISKLYADFNSVVREGQIVAQIDPTFLQQSVKDAEASLDRARAQFADARRALQRTKTLFEKNLESQVTYDATTTAFETNQAAMKQAQASLDRAKINLAYATIYAPINGVVIDRKVNVGQTVAASFSSPTLYTIANDLSKMQVQTTVDESDIGRVSISQTAAFTVDAYPDETFSGTVSQIRLAPVSVQNVINYSVFVNVYILELKLMPGMTANVRIMVASAQQSIRVPNLALRFQPPAELIDSARIAGQRGSVAVLGGQEGDTARGRGGRTFDGQASPERRQRFEKVRDSIVAAHGGTMDNDRLFAEVRKVMGGPRSGSRRQEEPAARVVPPRDDSRYGITQVFPEYQKSASTVARQSGRGRIWVMNDQGKLEPVFVRTGVTDGRYTAILTGSLKDGDQVVMGVSSNDESAEVARSPLTGQGQRGLMGRPGGPR